MRSLLARLFPVGQYELLTERERAQIVYATLFTGMIALILYSVVARVWSVEGIDGGLSTIQAMAYRPELALLFVGMMGTVVAGYWLVRVGRLNIGRWAPFAVMLVLNAMVGLLGESVEILRLTEPMTWIILIGVGGLMAGFPGIVVGVIYALVILVLRLEVIPQQFLLTMLLQIGLTSVVVTLLVRQIRISRSEGQTLDTRERLLLAEINAQITSKAAVHVPLQDILDTTIDLILRNFPQVYHVQIFLLDEHGVQAQLVASTGEAGRVLLAREHALAVGSLSVIGQCTFTGEVITARAGASGSMHRPNPLLPDTLLEVAFPLRVGEQIIGALDLQSRTVRNLSSNEIATFQTLSDSLSLAIADVRQYEIVRAQAQENQRLAEQARETLREVERLNQRLIGRAWSDFLAGRGESAALELDLEEGQETREAAWTPTLEQAALDNRIVRQQGTVAVPLRVRGQVIGAMEFELDDAGKLTKEDLELIEEISERFGLAADNTRLVEQSQRTAQREALVNEISSRLQSANSVEGTLREAARSLTDALRARRVQIHLGSPENAAPAKQGESA